MSATAIPLMASVTAAEVLTLVLPVAVLLAVVVWYTWLWMRGEGER